MLLHCLGLASVLVLICSPITGAATTESCSSCSCPCECTSTNAVATKTPSAFSQHQPAGDGYGPRFTIGAFNVKTLGKTKMSKPHVAARIKEIVERYDVILLQEIRDTSVDYVKQLLGMLSGPYDFVISEPIGRTSYKEQYAYFYRTDRVQIEATHQYNDTNDVFEREPFSVLLSLVGVNTGKLALIGLHARPSHAVAEIGHLVDVIDAVKLRFGCDVEPVVLGDLNADCRYATLDRRLAAGDPLTLSASSVWLLGEDVDTTTSSTDCAYDRIVVQSSLEQYVWDAQVFDFCDSMELDSSECYEVSDHYPVEMVLRF